MRYKDFCTQIQKRERTFENFYEGIWLFSIGLTKKILLADRLVSFFHEAVKAGEGGRSVFFAWTGIAAYMLYIYYDFSGYSDMAAGLAKLFGFRFEANFNYPYLSGSISEYWRRWHISMGEFFREYLYYPMTLGVGVKVRKRLSGWMGRKASGKAAGGFVLFTVWMATGLWHGARGAYLVWGFLNFLCIFYEQNRKKPVHEGPAKILGHIFTLLILAVNSTFFAVGNLKGAGRYLYSMLPVPGNALWDEWGIYLAYQYRTFLIAGLVFCFPVVETISKKLESRYGRQSTAVLLWEYARAAAMAALFCMDIIMVLAGGYSPSVYRNF